MKFVHLTIRSSKKDETVAFYQKYCGLKIRRELGEMITFLSDEEDATCLEVIGDQEHTVKTEGLSVGFAVKDAAVYREEIKAQGLAVTEMISPHPGVEFFFTKDPNGIDVQFISQ